MSFSIAPNLSNLLPLQEQAFLDSFYGGTADDLSWLRQSQNPRPLRMNGLNAAVDFREVSEGQVPDAVALEQGFQEVFTYTSHALRVPISSRVLREMAASETPGLLAEYTASFADSARRRILTNAYSILNNATSSDFAKGDGQPLLSASHVSNGTTSNFASATLSFSSLELGTVALRQTTGADGQRLGLRPAVLIVGSALAPTAFQVTEAAFDSDDRSAPNYIGSLGLKPIVSDYFTLSNGWIILAEQAIARGVCRMNIMSGPAPKMIEVPNSHADMQLIDELQSEQGTMTWRGIYGASS